MHFPKQRKPTAIVFFLFFLLPFCAWSQCSIQMGAAPESATFNTKNNGPGGTDSKWTITADSINGIYAPAVAMTGLDDNYYKGGTWISFSATGEHSGNRYFFYKRDFELPCFDLCGNSFNDNNRFCLNLDLYTDNSVFEIYVNGIPQSANLGNIPLSNPFNPVNHTPSDKTPVSLCSNWKAGANSLIIQLASSGTVAGLMAVAPAIPPPPPDAIIANVSICHGEHYQFGTQDLVDSGNYNYTFHRSSGCDSVVYLHLSVKQKVVTTIRKSICYGDNYAGYTATGTYTDTYPSANNCDSVRTLELTVMDRLNGESDSTALLCSGDSLFITPGVFDTYLWQDGSVTDHFIVRNTGLYSVTTTNACGTRNHKILVRNGICQFYFPAGFTPDHNGRNDNFKILTNALPEHYHLSVYNRWGQQIFSTTDPAVGWDGTFNGHQQPAGVYAWYSNFQWAGAPKSMRGTVTLIR